MDLHPGGGHVTPAPTLQSLTTPPPYHTQQQTIRTTASSKPLTRGSKFIMELNEPGDELPNQTRKFLLYFQSPVTPNINSADNTITFTPSSGGTYSGFMQLAYLGAGPRGDRSNDTVLDKYLGVYSYKPKASYCVQNDRRAYASFDWNPNNQYAYQTTGTLLMITMPHHVSFRTYRTVLAQLYTIYQKSSKNIVSTNKKIQGYLTQN